ncbi:MAG: hypothetical protein U0836_11150 [Pirellulales bacterium]
MNSANLGQWRRIVARTATTLTVDADFPANISATDKFHIGQTASSNPLKAIELRRSFNGGTKRVDVYPQKCAVNYVGF